METQSKINLDLKCLCDHAFKSHTNLVAHSEEPTPGFNKHCTASVYHSKYGYYTFCPCPSFKMNNLYYLESKYKNV